MYFFINIYNYCLVKYNNILENLHNYILNHSNHALIGY